MWKSLVMVEDLPSSSVTVRVSPISLRGSGKDAKEYSWMYVFDALSRLSHFKGNISQIDR